MPSLPAPLRSLVRPGGTFADWQPSVRLAVAALAVVLAVNVASTFLAAGVVGDVVQGSVIVENPDHRGGVFCTPGAWPDNYTTPSGCTEPRLVERRLAPAAVDAVRGLAAGAAAAVLVGWLTLAAAAEVAVRPHDDVPTDRLVALAAWAWLPAVFRYGTRYLAIRTAADGWRYPTGSIEAVRGAAVGLVVAPQVDWHLAVVAVTVGWQVAVFARGLAAVADLPRYRTHVPVGLFGAALLAAQVLPLAPPAAVGAAGAAGTVLALLGLANVFAPRVLISLDTSLELVGMRGREAVSPKPWYVQLHRLGGLLAIAAAAWLVGGYHLG